MWRRQINSEGSKERIDEGENKKDSLKKYNHKGLVLVFISLESSPKRSNYIEG